MRMPQTKELRPKASIRERVRLLVLGSERPLKLVQDQEPQAWWFGFILLISRILGFAREALIAALFPRGISDVFFAAFRFPNLLRRVVHEGACVESFPRFQASADSEKKKIVQEGIGLFFWFSVGFVILRIFSAKQLDLVQVSLVLALGLYVLCLGVFGYGSLWSNVHHHWKRAQWGILAFSICISVATLVFAPLQLVGLGMGVGIAGAVQCFAVLERPLLAGLHKRLMSCLTSKTSQELIGGILVVGFVPLIGLIISFRISDEHGAISYYYWAERLLEFPLGLIASSQAQSFKLKAHQSSLKSVNRALGWTFLLSLFAGFGLWQYSEQIARILFVRGEFTSHDAEQLAQVLRFCAPLVLTLSISRLAGSICASIHGSRFIVRTYLVAISAVIIGQLWIYDLQTELIYFNGLALGLSIFLIVSTLWTLLKIPGSTNP
jgi:putative peptidoglycan lipid II flippase